MLLKIERCFSAKRLPLLLGFGFMLVVALYWAFSPREPAYKGRTISVWLRNYPQIKQKDWREAEAAMKAFGTNGIPYILKAFTEKNTFWKYTHGRLWHYGPTWMKKAIGLPDLRRFDTTYAPEVFAAIGTSSIPALIEGLKEKNPTVQLAACRALGDFGPEANGAIEEMHRCLASAPTNSKLHFAVRDSIARIEFGLAPRVNVK